MILCEIVCVELVRLYKVTENNGEDHTLMTMAFIQHATVWFDIINFPEKEKTSAMISQLFNTTWLAS